MNPAAGKDYSFLLQAPEQLREIFARWRQPDGRGLTLTHPVVPMPTAEWVVQTLAQPDGERIMAEAMGRREKLIRDMVDDPYRWGYELQSWKDADELLKTKRSILITGPNRASKTDGSGSVGQLAAVQAHLEDMRTLVFKNDPSPSPRPTMAHD